MYKGKRVRKRRRHNDNGNVLIVAYFAAIAAVCLFSAASWYTGSGNDHLDASIARLSTGDKNVVQVCEKPPIAQQRIVAVEPDCVNPYDVPYDGNGRMYPEITWHAELGDDDRYYLAKIVKCEAGICDMETKIRHALVVLNRVYSDSFPDTVYDVITQQYNGVYQFSPVIPGGTWYKLEPDDECYQAVDYATSMEYDISYGATYFEATGSSDVWHQKALRQVCESDGVRFYVVP